MEQKDNVNAIRQIESAVSNLAAKYRKAGTLAERNAIVQQYHELIHQLYEMGWDDYLDVDAELPDRDLPEIYKTRAAQL